MVYITYNMGTRDLPDIYARALGLGHIYQANPSCPCYNYYIYIVPYELSAECIIVRLSAYSILDDNRKSPIDCGKCHVKHDVTVLLT